MFVWRPVLEHVATWSEVRDDWCFDDLLDAHDALDTWIAAQSRARG
jgi:hypothetical protein